MKRLSTTILLLVLCLLATGQTHQFYTSERLSSNQITCIQQDGNGYVWIGTEYGLNKYDGYRFTNYLHHEDDSASLQSDNIASLFVDRQGTLWAGSGKGLACYHPERNSFERILLTNEATPRVNDIVQRDDDHLLIGTAGYGLFELTLSTHQVRQAERYAHQGDNDYFSHLLIDDDGNFWKAGNNPTVTCRMNDSQHTLHTYQSPVGTVTTFLRYQSGVLMVCKRGLLFCRNGQIIPDFIDISMLGGDPVQLRSALCDMAGNLFIGTLGKGLCWVPQGSHRLQRYEYANAPLDLNTTNVWALFEDNQENLWVGCLKRGLLLLPQRKPQFNTWTFSGQNVSIGGSLTSISLGDDGITWCAIQNNGIYGFDASGRIVAHPDSPAGTYSIYRDRQSHYWVGTSKGLYSYQPLTGKYQKEADFDSDYINVMTDDAEGHLYFSTFSKGFCMYDVKNKTLRNFAMQQQDQKRGRLHNNWVMSMMIDSRGMVWIGTSSNLCCYDPHADTFRPYGWEVLMERKTITSLYETSDHRILIGTENGLYLYRHEQKDVVPYPRAEALSDKVICGIQQDRFGDLWCSTSVGIWQYQREKDRFIAHVYGNGLSTREYVWGIAEQSTGGGIFFGISEGITSFQPADLRTALSQQSTVHLTGLLMNGNPLPLSSDHHFSFSYLDNSFSMEFSLLNFSNTENVIYEYRMNGASDWRQTPIGNNVVMFNHLLPGSYTLEVRAYAGGVYTEPQTYHITIRAPWYSTSWAYLIYTLAALSLLFLLLWTYIRRRQQELDEDKMKFLINATHDIRSPLTLIMSPLHKLMRQDMNNEMREELKTIEHNATRIQNLVNQILDIRKIDKQQMKLQCQETDIVQYVGNLLKTYEYTARERNINFRYAPQLAQLKVWIDRKSMDKVVDNLLSNAFKYTYDGGEIEVRVAEGPEQTAELQFIDNGMGIKGDVRKLFDRFYQGSNSHTTLIEGTGIGLNLCKMMVEMHHGTIEAANRPDVQGSVFTVRLPLGNSHLDKEELLTTEGTEKTSKPRPQTNYRVLIVDDDEEIGDFIGKELGSYYRITAVTSGREALRRLLSAETEKQFDLVVSDVMMPEMDGFTFLRMVKTNMNLSHIPVVMLTSKADVANRLEGLEKGADAYLAKPFDMDELHVVINNLINKSLHLKGKFSGSQQQKDKIEEKHVKGNDEILMDRIMKAINEHLSDTDFNVEALTREVGISRAQLHRKMKEMTGLPISEFIRNIRLEQAVRLLEEQKINVTQVAYTVGFSNLAHFSTVFRKQFGVSPTEYVERKKANKNG